MDCSCRATICEELISETSFSRPRLQLCPEITLFRNIRTLSGDQWDSFNIATGELWGDGKGNIDKVPPKKKRKTHAPRSYHYTIGDYETSTYYIKFLSNRTVHVPFNSDRTVRELTHRLSKNPKSIFRAWFRMPLYKVELLSQRFADEKWVTCSHHCQTKSKLRIKIDLLIMGALAVLGGTVHSSKRYLWCVAYFTT